MIPLNAYIVKSLKQNFFRKDDDKVLDRKDKIGYTGCNIFL